MPNYQKIHKLLEEAAIKVFDEACKDGEYFNSLEFKVVMNSDNGGFETIVFHRTKPGFFSETYEKEKATSTDNSQVAE